MITLVNGNIQCMEMNTLLQIVEHDNAIYMEEHAIF